MPRENTAQGEYILSKNAKLVTGALAVICIVVAIVILLISYQRRNVVEINRQGEVTRPLRRIFQIRVEMFQTISNQPTVLRSRLR
jgi:hypothetical protein